MKPATLGASAVAGLATGSRSFTGLAAVVLATPGDAQAQPDRLLSYPATKTVIGLFALQEWVLDKLPQTPSRLEARGLATRAFGAGAAGAIIARRAQVEESSALDAPDAALTASPPGEPPAVVTPVAPDWSAIAGCAAASAGAAFAFAIVGVHVRGWLHQSFGRDWPAAGFEDAVSAGLAGAAVHMASRS